MVRFDAECWICDVQDGIVMGKSAPSPPPAPAPSAVSSAQQAANINTAEAQSALNNVNQVTPYGTSSFNVTGSTTDNSGDTIPTYTQTVSLNPNSQAALTNEQQLAKTLSGYGTQIAANSQSAIEKPLDFSSLPATPTSLDMNGAPALPQPGDFQNEADQATQAAYKQAQGLVQPQQDYAKQQLAAQLNNQGIPITSEAAQEQENLLANQQTAQNNNLAEGAVGLGQSEQAQLESEALGSRQQATSEASANAGLQQQARAEGITEQQLAQTQPINELSALLQGGQAIQSPNAIAPSQTGISPTDVTGAYSLGQSAANNAYNAQVAQATAGNQSAATGAATAITAAAAIY